MRRLALACRFGFHRWSTWHNKQVLMQVFRNGIAQGRYPETIQERMCMECGRKEWRELS